MKYQLHARAMVVKLADVARGTRTNIKQGMITRVPW